MSSVIPNSLVDLEKNTWLMRSVSVQGSSQSSKPFSCSSARLENNKQIISFGIQIKDRYFYPTGKFWSTGKRYEGSFLFFLLLPMELHFIEVQYDLKQTPPLLVVLCTYTHSFLSSPSLTSEQELYSLGEGKANLTGEIHKVVYLDAVRDSVLIHTPTGTRGEKHDMLNILHTVYGGLYIHQSTVGIM